MRVCTMYTGAREPRTGLRSGKRQQARWRKPPGQPSGGDWRRKKGREQERGAEREKEEIRLLRLSSAAVAADDCSLVAADRTFCADVMLVCMCVCVFPFGG